MVEIDPVVLPEGVLMGGKTELSGDDEVVAVRECNDEIERGISLVYAGLLLWKERASGGWRWTKKPKPKGCAFLLRKTTKQQERPPRRTSH